MNIEKFPNQPLEGSIVVGKIPGINGKTVSDFYLSLAPNLRYLLTAAFIISTAITTLSNGATVRVQEVNHALKTAAALSTNMANATNNDLTLTAVTGGTAGNSISLTLTNPGTPSASLSVSSVGSAISASLATDAGTAQIETATAVGSITGSGNATVVVTGAGITGSPVTLSVAVLNTDTAATWAGKVRTALAANAPITALYTVGGSSATITLTRTVAAANDGTLNISLDNGTCTGITTAGTSANSTAGVAPAITTTASLLRTALNANSTIAGLVTTTLKSGNDGTGLVSALSLTSLAGGLEHTVIQTLVSAVDLADTDAAGTLQALTIAQTSVITGGNALLFSVTGAATATLDTKEAILELAAI